MDVCNLSWNSYPEKVREMLEKMLTTDQFTDVTLVCDDQTQFKAHKTVLSSFSPVFRNILLHNDHRHPLIFLRGIKQQEMESILQFLYLGQATVYENRVNEFLNVAKDLDIEGVGGNQESFTRDPLMKVGNQQDSFPSDVTKDNNDSYFCKVSTCGMEIKFENCGRRSKILSHYCYHFQTDLQQSYAHFITEERQCRLCQKDLSGFINSKMWIHIGVHHDKINEILVQKGITPIYKDTLKEGKENIGYISIQRPEKIVKQERETFDGPMTANTCKICGQRTQNKKRLLKHYCTKHYKDNILALEESYIVHNKCLPCKKQFIGTKKSTKVIHIGVYHQKIHEILQQNLGQGIKPSLQKTRFVVPKSTDKARREINYQYLEVNETEINERFKEIENLGPQCQVCGKEYTLFRSTLLPHYAGHFYTDIAQGIETFFPDDDTCKHCDMVIGSRKSKVIHIAVKHGQVIPYIENITNSEIN